MVKPYNTFKKLAGNYCKERVTPHLEEILRTYGKNSYKNIKKLVRRLNPSAEFPEAEDSPKRSYEVLSSIPDYIWKYFDAHLRRYTDEDIAYCKFLDKMLESYLHGELKDKRVELTEEQIQELENKEEEVRGKINKECRGFLQ